MGVKTETLGFIHQALYAVWPDLKFAGKYMVELGDQKFNARTALKPWGERVWAKEYFEQLGFHHYCIDWHGQHGAFPLDLGKPIDDPFWVNRFDVLTNLGTSEHVDNQAMCWGNIHNLVKTGGVFIHVLPHIGWWPGHSPYVYEARFFTNMALVNGYHLVFNEFLSSVKCHAVCFIKQKPSRAFVWDSLGLVENSNESHINL